LSDSQYDPSIVSFTTIVGNAIYLPYYIELLCNDKKNAKKKKREREEGIGGGEGGGRRGKKKEKK
jgi:hypothetical protein